MCREFEEFTRQHQSRIFPKSVLLPFRGTSYYFDSGVGVIRVGPCLFYMSYQRSDITSCIRKPFYVPTVKNRKEGINKIMGIIKRFAPVFEFSKEALRALQKHSN